MRLDNAIARIRIRILMEQGATATSIIKMLRHNGLGYRYQHMLRDIREVKQIHGTT